MIIGFTGTRQGLSAWQRILLFSELRAYARADFEITTGFTAVGATPEFHHGGCVGADAEAHQMARTLGYRIVVHWPENRKHEANLSGPFVSAGRKPYLIRNEDIVKACDLLIATPLTDKEQLRSGTWSTIRMARRLGKRCLIINRNQS